MYAARHITSDTGLEAEPMALWEYCLGLLNVSDSQLFQVWTLPVTGGHVVGLRPGPALCFCAKNDMDPDTPICFLLSRAAFASG